MLNKKCQHTRAPHPRRHLIREFVEALTIGLDFKGGLHHRSNQITEHPNLNALVKFIGLGRTVIYAICLDVSACEALSPRSGGYVRALR